MRTKLLISVLSLMFLSGKILAGFEINTTLMHYTYLIVGPAGEPNQVKCGTVFVMGIPDANRPGKSQPVMVTAAHVLEGISGETAIIHLREKTTERKFESRAHVLQIRKGEEPLWVRHPNADVAVMKITLPDYVFIQAKKIPGLSTNLLADDETIEKYEIHPGDELQCLGYPLGKGANVSGFAILRSGKVASYPLTPAKETKSFFFDFEVFRGNSGGPVYFVDEGRTYGGITHAGETIQFVVGLVSQQHEELRLAVVVPAHFIKETLELLDKK